MGPSRQWWLIAVALAAACAPAPDTGERAAESPKRPNILLILIDDLGFEAIGAYGGASYETPNIDRLAADGVRFAHAYSTPLCAPSRLKLMTGRYNSRNYTEWGVLPPDEVTVANLLQDTGYATFMAGKWQMSGFEQVWAPGKDCCEGQGQTPEEAGFDDYLVWHYHEKGERYADPLLWGPGGEGGIHEGEYGPDLFVDFLLDRIESQVAEDSERPFFAYYPMALVHAPFVPTPDSGDWTANRKAQDPAYFGDMVAYTDKLIGRLVAGFEGLGVRDNTLLLLTADNGTPSQITSTLQDGTVIPGGKGGTIDYGSHVPFIASWPAGIEGGRVTDALVDFSDFLPSVVEAAGAVLPDDRVIDGRSFLPVLRGEADSTRDWVFTDFRPRFLNIPEVTFVHDRRYKLYDDGRFFDFEDDVREQSPLAPDDLTEEAAAAMARLRAAMVKTRLPHIVLIVPDDLGRHDVSFHGGDITTPNIDRIAAEGVLIERFYTAPICSPTRAGLMTGRYPIRYGLMRNVIAPWQDFGLDTEEVTLPEVLAAAGYEHRAVFGKWHLGHVRREHHPLQRGFTEFVGHNTSIDYFTKERFGETDWFHGYEPASEEGYVTDLVAEHAVGFINRHASGDAPFFLYVPFNAAHSPLQAKEQDLPRYAHLDAVEPPRSWEEVTAGWPLPP